MGVVIMLGLMSVGLALAIVLLPPPPGRTRAWRLRASWALWVLQPTLLIGVLLAGLTIMERYGYNSSNAPDDVQNWLAFAIFGTVGLALLAGTVLGALAWRAARLEQPATPRRWWALSATVANTLWFAGGAWLIGAPAVAVGLDVLILVLALALLLWPMRHPELEPPWGPDSGLPGEAAASADEHLVG
jgi:hypothetical protein